MLKSVEYLDAVFSYLDKQKIDMYRMSSDIAPYVTHPDMPQFHNQVTEARTELIALGRKALGQGLRLSFHPSQYTILNSPNPELNRKSVLDIESQATILDTMAAGPEGCVVVHVGGVYGDKASAMDRWAESYHALPEASKRRLVLENDDISYSAANVLELHSRTGVPLVFDSHHFCCNNPERLDLADTARKFLASWPKGVRPKTHVSSPRTQMRELKRKNKKTKKNRDGGRAAFVDRPRRLHGPVCVHRPDEPDAARSRVRHHGRSQGEGPSGAAAAQRFTAVRARSSQAFRTRNSRRDPTGRGNYSERAARPSTRRQHCRKQYHGDLYSCGETLLAPTSAALSWPPWCFTLLCCRSVSSFN